jgi:hypothetical protein
LSIFPYLGPFEGFKELELILNFEKPKFERKSSESLLIRKSKEDQLDIQLYYEFKRAKKKRKKITSKHDFREILDDEKEIFSFEEYLRKNNLYNHFLFFKTYFKYQNEDETKRKTIEKEIFEKFVDSKSEFFIEFPNHIILKRTSSFDDNDVKLMYKQVFRTLQLCYQKYWILNKQNESNEKNIPKSFDDLLQMKKVYKLFSNYVSNHYGELYIQCFNDLVEYNRTNSTELKNKLLKYCLKNSKQCCIFNISLRNQLVRGDQFVSNWDSNLFDLIRKILMNEYYERFLNTKIWKDYLNSFLKEKELKFEDSYTILKVKMKKSILFQNVDFLSVQNKLTMEYFTAKRIISDNSSLKFFIKLFRSIQEPKS